MNMRISYIPENMLKMRGDCKFFFKMPFKAAAYNFQMSINSAHVKEHDRFNHNVDKVEEVAKTAIEGTQKTSTISLCDKIVHFLAHVGLALILLVPLLNFFPFVVLVIKAKENREAAPPDGEAIKVETPVEPQKPVLRPERPQVQPQRHTPQQAIRVQPLSRPQQPSHVTPTKKVSSEASSVKSSPTIVEVRKLEQEAARLYFQIFPEDCPKELISIPLEEAVPSLAKELGQLVFSSSPVTGMSTKKRLGNLVANLTELREFLNEKFPKVGGDPAKFNYCFKGTFDTNIQHSGVDNPYRIFKWSVAQKFPDEFSDFIKTVKMKLENNVILIDPNQIL